MAPALLALGGTATILPVWTMVAVSGYLSGRQEAGARLARRQAYAPHPWSPAQVLSWKGPAILRITGWPAPTRNEGWQAPARLMLPHVSAWDPQEEISLGVLAPGQGLLLRGRGRPPTPGAIITGEVTVRVPSPQRLPGGFDQRRFLAGRSLHWVGRINQWCMVPVADPLQLMGQDILQPLRQSLTTRLDSILPPREAAVAKAVLLGIKDNQTRQAGQPFATLGLAHLFAVSGLHVGILLGIVVVPGRLLGLPGWMRTLLPTALLPGYVLLTGMPGSVVRAAGLGAAALMAGPCGRQCRPLSLLGLLFWGTVVWDPHQVLDTGLRLSYFAAGGILAVSQRTNGFRFEAPGLLRLVIPGLAVSITAQWFTLPFAAASFGRISLLSPAANLIAVPLFGCAVWSTALGLALSTCWAWAADAVGAWAWILFRFLAGAVSAATGPGGGLPLGLPVPGAWGLLSWLLLTGGMLALLSVRTHSRRWRPWTFPGMVVGLIIGLSILGPLSRGLSRPAAVTVWQFDVGQGNCGLLVFPDGWTALIDTGGQYGPDPSGTGPMVQSVLPFLEREGVASLDVGILTHGHRDHTGGAAALTARGLVRQWLVAGKADLATGGGQDSSPAKRPAPGEILHRWRDWEFLVVYPPADLPAQFHENDHSLVAVLRQGTDTRMVWSGDLEGAGEALLMAEGSIPADTDVWKAGHHGSDTSGTPAFVEHLSPELVLISCGLGNGYGHPSHGPYEAGDEPLKLVRTDLGGSIRIQWDSDGTYQYNNLTKYDHLGWAP